MNDSTDVISVSVTENMNFSNDVTEPECTKFSPGTTVTLAIVLAVVALVTILGNALVMVSFATDKKLRSFGNYFILNLSIADFIIGMLIAVYTPYVLTGCWKLSKKGCQWFNFVDYITPLASAWNMAVISLDRYYSVAKPIQYRVKQNTKIALGLMSVPWIVGILMFFPTTLFWENMTGESLVPDGLCFVDFYASTGYLIFVSVVEFITPFVIVSTINLLIYLNIRRRSRGLGGATGNQVATITAQNQETNKAKDSLARDKKSARSLAILVGVFFITWAPYEVCALVNPICGFCIPDGIFDVVFWLLWTNSTVNPILYPFLQKRFRIAFSKILCCGRLQIEE